MNKPSQETAETPDAAKGIRRDPPLILNLNKSAAEASNLCGFVGVREGSWGESLADSQKIPTVAPMSKPPQETAETPDAAKGIRRTETKLAAIDPERAERIRRDPPLILDLNEASAVARCAVRTMREHIRRRSISSIKLGGRVLLERDQLLADLRKLTLKSV